jgi:putative ABC transport system permease protein
MKIENREIIGVMKDFHFLSLHHEIGPLVLSYSPRNCDILNIRLSAHNVSATLGDIAKTLESISPGHPFEYQFYDESFAALYENENRFRTLFQVFSLLSLFIACLGLLGLSSFLIERKTKEIGIRKVMGAGIPSLIVHLSKSFTKWVILANLIAWPLVLFFIIKWLRGFAFHTRLGPGIFLMAAFLTLGVALLTVIYQTVKAAAADPVDSLRYE